MNKHVEKVSFDMDNFDSGGNISSSRQESIDMALRQLQRELNPMGGSAIVRPDICLWRMLLRPAVCLSAVLLVYYIPVLFSADKAFRLTLALLLFAVLFFCGFKRLVVDAILIYQRYAPESLRAACVFKPSCSNYMLLAIEKYGAFPGVIKGIRRLFRCKYPNGGIDYP